MRFVLSRGHRAAVPRHGRARPEHTGRHPRPQGVCFGRRGEEGGVRRKEKGGVRRKEKGGVRREGRRRVR